MEVEVLMGQKMKNKKNDRKKIKKNEDQKNKSFDLWGDSFFFFFLRLKRK